MRVYEAARDYNVESKEILDLLTELGHPVRSASSNVPLEAVDVLEDRYADRKAPETEDATGEPGAEPAAAEAEPETPRPFLEPDIAPKVEKIVIGLPDEKPKKARPEPQVAEDEKAEEADSEAEAEEPSAEEAQPEGEDRQKELKRILREKGKVKLHTKIHKSQRSINETSDAIRLQIMRSKAKRFGDFRRKREEERLRKAAEEEAKRKAEEAARRAEEEAKAAEEAAKRAAEAPPVEAKPAEAPPAEAPPAEAPPKEVKAKGKKKAGRRVEIVAEEDRKEEAKPKAAEKAEPGRARPSAPGRRPPPRRPPSRPTRRQSKFAWKREKRARFEAQREADRQQAERDARTIRYNETTTVANVASDLGLRPTELIKKLMELGMMVTIQQRLDPEIVQIIAEEYEYEVEESSVLEDETIFADGTEDKPENLKPRPPVVTIMGHVDHGKTKLLDAIREANVVASEAGGITQHIGAYEVVLEGKGTVVFLDTPGHEAFTAMRARGALVTDIVVLVVAATEGVMPQTVEAINHAKAAEVPILVALNKMDLPDANPDRVKQQLTEHGLVAEEWGGKTIYVPISALQKEGIEDLLEALLLEAEILELKANPDKRARGTIVESKLDKGRGPVATVLVEEGTLRPGDAVVTGVYSGRVRAMTNDRGDPVEVAGPATPVEILGLEGVPMAGEPFVVIDNDKEAKQISVRLQQAQRERELHRVQHVSLDHLYAQIEEGVAKQLNLVIRGDVHGSVEALCESLAKIESDKVRVEVIHSGVGTIHESDIMLASASNALVIGFNVRPGPKVEEVARRENVEIRCYRLIYQAIEEMKNAMVGLLDKKFQEVRVGRSEVREVFRSSKLGTVAGVMVTDGRMIQDCEARLIRDDVVVHEGKIDSLRRFKDEVREVRENLECGIGFAKFSDIRKGDIVECYQLQEVEQTL